LEDVIDAFSELFIQIIVNPAFLQKYVWFPFLWRQLKDF